MGGDVELRVLDDRTLEDLLEVAVADAAPEEVMPPVAGSPGWTVARREAFLAFFRPMLGGVDTTIYAIMVDGEIAGFMRLKRLATVAETGMWLGRSWRGKGVGAAALRRLLREAACAGFVKVVADTTPGNVAALGVLRGAGARIVIAGDRVYAEMAIDPAYS